MSKTNGYNRFCGIDIAKQKHVARIIDRNGLCIVRSQSFMNNTRGFKTILERLQSAGGPQKILVGMEATGHYWNSLHDFLVEQGYKVAVLNPIQTSQQSKKGIRKTKTDNIDAGHIATLIKNGDHRPALVPGELATSCRYATRLRHTLTKQNAKLKQLLWSRLHPAWPEYESLFTDPFCATARKLLAQAPLPEDVLDMEPAELIELIRTASRGRFGPAKAQKIRQAATETVGTNRGRQGLRISIRTLIAQLEAVQPVRLELDRQIEQLAEQIPAYIRTLPGAGDQAAVSLFGETDPIETFTSPSQLVAFAGLDPTVYQSSGPPKPSRRISKRGSPFLRNTLWHMTQRACFQEGDLRDYWLKRRRQGLTHRSAVAATAIKLCHLSWRIMTDRRDYLPTDPNRKP